MTASLSGLSHTEERAALQDVGALFYEKNWSLGTSSNYSCVIGREPLRLLITASGKDKRQLGSADFLIVDGAGKPVSADAPKPSAETMLHVVAARRQEVGAVLHTHSVWSTVLSDFYDGQEGFWLQGYEMQKGLSGVTSHEDRVWVRIFENTQNIAALSEIVEAELNNSDNPLKHGFLIRRHGLYTWGKDLSEAKRHVEIFEFLFEVLGRRLSIAAGAGG